MAIVPNDRPTPARTHINGTNQSPVDIREKRLRDFTGDDQESMMRDKLIKLFSKGYSCRSIGFIDISPPYAKPRTIRTDPIILHIPLEHIHQQHSARVGSIGLASHPL